MTLKSLTDKKPKEINIKWDTGSMTIYPEEIMINKINKSKFREIIRYAKASDEAYGTKTMAELVNCSTDIYNLVESLQINAYKDYCYATESVSEICKQMQNNAGQAIIPEKTNSMTAKYGSVKFENKEISAKLKEIQELGKALNEYNKMLNNITTAQMIMFPNVIDSVNSAVFKTQEKPSD